jgi:cytochrome c biogenesis protein CcdA
MGDVPVALAFAAGLVATVNPCGFAMLPAYLSYFTGLDGAGTGGRGTSVARGLVVGVVVSAGFLVVFGISGAVVNAGYRSIIDFVPWAALVIGVLLASAGVVVLVGGLHINVSLPRLTIDGPSRRYRSMFLFGVGYAVASLSCTLPVFLAVTGVAGAAPTFLTGVLTYVLYALGMSTLLVVLTVAVSVAKTGVVLRLRWLLPHVGRISGAILLLSGVYITVYWAANLRDPLAARGTTFRVVERFQTWLSDQFGSRPELWAVVFGLVLTAATAYVVGTKVVPAGRSRVGRDAGPPDREASDENAVTPQPSFRNSASAVHPSDANSPTSNSSPG